MNGWLTLGVCWVVRVRDFVPPPGGSCETERELSASVGGGWCSLFLRLRRQRKRKQAMRERRRMPPRLPPTAPPITAFLFDFAAAEVVGGGAGVADVSVGMERVGVLVDGVYGRWNSTLKSR